MMQIVLFFILFSCFYYVSAQKTTERAIIGVGGGNMNIVVWQGRIT
jgi:hypothetical protein